MARTCFGLTVVTISKVGASPPLWLAHAGHEVWLWSPGGHGADRVRDRKILRAIVCDYVRKPGPYRRRIARRRGGPPGPTDVDARFCAEDVRYGLLFCVALGEPAGVAMKATQTIVDAASLIAGRDFMAGNDLLEPLWLRGETLNGLLERVHRWSQESAGFDRCRCPRKRVAFPIAPPCTGYVALHGANRLENVWADSQRSAHSRLVESASGSAVSGCVVRQRWNGAR